jgi:TonB-linked SusC/RagA family outer membrane protein
MRIAPNCCLIACLLVSARLSAQRVSLSEREAPLEQVFRHIEQQSGYVFFFDVAWLRKARPVTLELKDVPLSTALEGTFKNQPLQFSVVGRNIVLQLKADSVAKKERVPVVAPNGIHGHVMDSLGRPLAGASIAVNGTRTAVRTDEEGNFFLPGVKGSVPISITYVGYESREFRLPDPAMPDIILRPAGGPLDEVQVVAYGNTTRRLSTGTISTVNSEVIAQNPVPDVLQALQGRMPGLFITQQTGLPNGAFTVQVRSLTTLTNQQPLYVVDGVVFPANGTLPLIAGTGIPSPLHGGNALNYLDPSVIASVSLLRGADATAIYGSRGAYGVILITTKKGKPGKPRLTMDNYSGITVAGISSKLLNTQQYLELRREALKNDHMPVSASDQDLNGTWDTTRYTDWQKLMIGHHARTDKFTLHFSGGSERTSFLAGAFYNDQQNIERAKGSVRSGGVQGNINHRTRDKKLSITVSGYFSTNTDDMVPDDFSLANNGKFISAAQTAPNAPSFFLPDGSLDWSTGGNPLGSLNILYKNSTQTLIASTDLVYKPADGLSLNLKGGYTLMSCKELRAEPSTVFNPVNFTPSLRSSTLNAYRIHTYTIDPNVSYQRQLGRKGKVELKAGITLQERVDVQHEIFGSGYASDAVLRDPVGGNPAQLSVSDDVEPNKYLGFFGAFQYNWDNKYILHVNARRDGSTKFGPDRQFGNFGSVGAAWLLSEEPWFRSLLSVINFLKIRGSYGTEGGDGIPNYQYINTYSTGTGYQGGSTLVPNQIANPKLQWETNRDAEIALSLELLKGRIFAEGTYYSNRTSNQLALQNLSSVTGNNVFRENSAALIRTHGFELVLTTQNIRTPHFSWTTSFNISTPRSKLVYFPGQSASGTTYYSYFIGKPITGTVLFHYAGVDPATGLYQFINTQGVKGPFRPILDPVQLGLADRNQYLDLAPKFYGGWQNSLRYKRFTMDFLFTFVKRIGETFVGRQSTAPGFFDINPSTAALRRWRKPGDRTDIPAVSEGLNALINQQNFTFSTGAYSDASYARLANLNIGYNIEGAVLEKSHISSMRVYLAGQNLLTISSFKDLDPENLGYYGFMGPLRVLTVGIIITF